jgi:hypothetical protein
MKNLRTAGKMPFSVEVAGLVRLLPAGSDISLEVHLSLARSAALSDPSVIRNPAVIRERTQDRIPTFHVDRV